MFMRALVDDGGLPLDGFTQSLRLFASIGDDPGSASAWSDPLVHGAGVQRRQAEGVGYEATDTQQCLGYNDWAEQPPVSLGGEVEPAAATCGDRYLLGRYRVRPDDARRPRHRRRRAVHAAASRRTSCSTPCVRRLGDSLSDTLVPGGFLDARGWATGSGARVTFTDATGPAASGVAAIQSGSDGIDRVFVSTSDDVDRPPPMRSSPGCCGATASPQLPIRRTALAPGRAPRTRHRRGTSDGTPTPDRVARTAPIEDADPQ